MTYCSYYHQKIKLEVKVNSAYKPSGPSGQLLSVFSFSGMKQLGVFVNVLPPVWDARPSPGYLPPVLKLLVPIYTLTVGRERGTVRVHVKRLPQERNTMFLARAQNWNHLIQSGAH